MGGGRDANWGNKLCPFRVFEKKKKKPFRIGRTAGSGYFKNFKESPGFVKDST